MAYIPGTPWLLATIIIALFLADALWLWNKVNESKQAESEKQRHRKRSDSIWNDK